MDITDADRRRIAERIVAKRLTFRSGTKLDAYRAAVVNSGTWDRIEEGLPVRADRLAAAVRLFWPSTGGDWRKIPPEDAEAGTSELERVLDQYDIGAKARAEILAAAAREERTAKPTPKRRAQ